MQVMLIDNSEKELNLLVNALLKGYSKFKVMYKDVRLPNTIDIKKKLLSNYNESDSDRWADEIVRLIGDVPTYLVVDLFLTDIEHAKSFTREDAINLHSGYKLAKCISEKKCCKCKISLMSKQFPGENRSSVEFGRLIEKPIYKGSSESNPLLITDDILSYPHMCSDMYGLPKSLDTFKVLEAFQNIVFFNAVKA